MKEKKIFDALGNIDDDIIAETDDIRNTYFTRKKRRKVLRAGMCVAVAVACAVILIATGVIQRFVKPEKEKFKQERFALAAAKYPVMAKYPQEADYTKKDGSFDYKAYDIALTEWTTSIKTLSDQYEGYRDGMTDFYKETITKILSDNEGKNVAYSPLNLYIALGMLSEVTDGNSRAQVLRVMGQEDAEAVRKKVNALWEANYRDDGAVTSILANSLWLRDGISYNTDTIKNLAEKYYASVYSGDVNSGEYNDAFREWINGNTKNMLKDMTSDLKFNDATVATLVSTICFQAKWENEFSEENTKEDIFTTKEGSEIKCDFLNEKKMQVYSVSGDNYVAVKLHLVNSGGMWIVLPNKDSSVDDILKGDALEAILTGKNAGYIRANVSIPKFDISSKLDLVELLAELGITDVFDDETSDFSPLTDMELYISRAEQGVRVMIDEEGCAAAAYTVMMMDGTGTMPPEEALDFVADRPFMFAITGTDGSVLFTGIINNPAE